MSVDAIILCDPKSFALRVAGLRVIDRLVVAVHRAGAETITAVSKNPLPPLNRTSALGIRVETVSALGAPVAGPVLLVESGLLVHAKDLEAVWQRRGRLVSPTGEPLPAGVVEDFAGSGLEEALAELPSVVAQRPVGWVDDAASARMASAALWASLGSTEDGWVDRHFNRPIGRWLSKALVYTAVSPNQVSIVAIALGLVSAFFFAQGNYRSAVWGAILLQVSAIIDCVDGELARVLFKESRWGKWLDIVGDQVVHMSVFASIGVGLYRSASGEPVIALATSAVIGVIISFIVVMMGRLQPEAQRNPRLQRWIDATTNRDFSVLLILLALVGKLSWFLWMTAIGVHLFWLTALGVKRMGQSPARVKIRS
jgi:phosphatidylglycerophosphate synthase